MVELDISFKICLLIGCLLNFKIREDWLNVSYSPIRYIVISIMALVLIGLAIHIARTEEGLNKWVILFGMLGLDGMFVWRRIVTGKQIGRAHV